MFLSIPVPPSLFWVDGTGIVIEESETVCGVRAIRCEKFYHLVDLRFKAVESFRELTPVSRHIEYQVASRSL